MSKTVYNKTTGQILFVTGSAEPTNTTGVIDGNYSSRTHRVDVATAQAIVLPDRPLDQPAVFDYSTVQWQIMPVVVSEAEARGQRNKLLQAVDRVNPIWYAAMTDQQRTDLAEYRTALLNVPGQVSFPESVVWPVKPIWL